MRGAQAFECPAIKPQTATARVFFALWPNAAIAAELARSGKILHDACGGRRTRKETIHLTLVFLGEVELARLDELVALAGEIRMPAFSLEITRWGCWPHNRVAWAGPQETPDELCQLVDELRRRLNCAGFRFDAKPFAPHVTLLRKADCRRVPLPDKSIAWPIRHFVLVRSATSDAGAAYEVIGKWALARCAASR